MTVESSPAGRHLAAGLAFHVDEHGRLVVTRPSGAHVGVIPIRCFPFSAPDQFIALCTPDGSEVAFIEQIEDLTPEAQAILRDELHAREFIPAIRRVLAISRGPDPTLWRVETDRGPTEFYLPNEDHVRRLGSFGVIMTDAHSVRYQIPDVRALDARSRSFLDRFL